MTQNNSYIDIENKTNVKTLQKWPLFYYTFSL
jgi:hypothetical protein